MYAADRIPKVISRPCALIINTDNHNLPGKHWCAIFIDRNGLGTFFDSYGLPPLNIHHHNAIRKNSVKYKWNAVCLQQDESRVCGHYCCVFLFHMCLKSSLKTFNDQFSQNKYLNDKKVIKLFKNYTKINKIKRNYCNAKMSVGHGFCNQSCFSKLFFLG